MSRTIRAALLQHACGEDKNTNLATSIAMIREAAGKGSELLVLPELHTTRYFCQTEDVARFDLAETVPGPATECLSAVAAELGIVLVASLFEKRAPGLHHNTAVVFERDGSIAGMYRKMHIPDDPGFHEKFYFAPGDIGFAPIATSVGRLGVLVCWDQWFPEAARLMTLRGAELLVYPTAIGWDPRDDHAEKERQRDAWTIAQRAHAVVNGLFVLSVNRVGHEPDPSGVLAGVDFWGSSFVAGPQGELLADAGATQNETLVADIDLRRTESVRRIWPFLRDRRIDAYDGLLKRYEA
ncbi:MAG TPA: carbon-nitrogen hydrolase [Candidatus Hydrogenedentes bacterium]|nr:carbon-nitrogen hydrolase [Candidatus Hydrogenedentota bacterium]HOS04244.1 carbon-nitrogen hydrolase [Candidatus Hydrogenedentota bacterium]